MSYITADESMLARLRGIAAPVEVRDPRGKVIGHYTPVRSPEEEALYQQAKSLFDLDKAREILARERNQGRPLKEILADLESSEKQG